MGDLRNSQSSAEAARRKTVVGQQLRKVAGDRIGRVSLNCHRK